MSVKSSGAGALNGVTATGLEQLLFVGRNLNFQLTTDQILTRVTNAVTWTITDVIARQRTGGASVVCVGGIYDGAGKTGNILVAAAQSWVTLAVGIIVPAVSLPILGAATPILSLTTGSTAAITGDLFIYGVSMD